MATDWLKRWDVGVVFSFDLDAGELLGAGIAEDDAAIFAEGGLAVTLGVRYQVARPQHPVAHVVEPGEAIQLSQSAFLPRRP